MATIDVKDAADLTVAIEKPLAPGRAAAAASRPVTLSTEDFAVLDGLEAQLTTQAGYLDGIETLLTAATPAGTNNIGDVDVLTVPSDPFGLNADAAATAGSTGSIQAKLRLMTSQLDSIKTSVEALDNTVAGSELQVDIVSGGSSGVQYTEGDVDTTITGNAMLFEGAANALVAAPGTATDGLLVNLGANNDVTVTGTVTVGSHAVTNAGTFATQATLAAGTNNIGDVDVLTVPADPFGANADAAATAGSTGSVQAKLRLMTTQLDAIKTAVETIDNTVSGSELQVDIVSGGSSGVQYTEGDTDATITGNALLFEGAANTIVAAPGTAADGLLVNLGANNDVTVTGTVTVGAHAVTNAGTFAVQDSSTLAAVQFLSPILPGTAADLAFNNTSAQSAAITATVVMLTPKTADCRIVIGSSPTALSTSTLLFAGNVYYFKITSGHKVAAIRDAAVDGTLNITPAT